MSQEPIIPAPIPDPNTPLAIPVPLNGKTAENLKTAFAAEARSNDRYHYFSTVAEKYNDANAVAVFKKIADDKHTFAQGHLQRCIAGGIGDPDTGKPSASISQVLETAIVTELSNSEKIYRQMAEDATQEQLPHLAEWFTELSRNSVIHQKQFEDLLQYYQGRPIPH